MSGIVNVNNGTAGQPREVGDEAGKGMPIQPVAGGHVAVSAVDHADFTAGTDRTNPVAGVASDPASPLAATTAGKVRRLLTDLFGRLLAMVYGIRWMPLSAVSNIILGAGVAPTLKALANGSGKISGAIDNSANVFQWLNLSLLVRGAAAFTSGGTVDVWIITALDGTNYEDGADAVFPARAPDGYFFLRAVDTAQRIEMPLIAVPPCKFKVLVRNSGGQAFTNTDAENLLNGYFHS